MSPQKLITHMRDVFAKCVSIAEKKNADYSGHNANAFRNFMHVEAMGVASVEAGILVRLSDKFSRMANLLKNDPKVVDEKLEDTIEDAINYLAILHAYRASKKNAPEVDECTHEEYYMGNCVACGKVQEE